MNKYLNTFGLLLIIILSSCKCDEIRKCSTLSDSALSWLNHNDTIKYINSSGSRIQFIISSKNNSEPYQMKSCSKNGLGGCICNHNYCESSGNFLAISDTTINGKNEYFVRIDEVSSDNKSDESSILNYTIFEFRNQINLLKPTELSTNDSLLASLVVGTYTYSNVYIQMIDTTITSSINKNIWKVYFTQLNGIVGFRTRQSQTFYYRE